MTLRDEIRKLSQKKVGAGNVRDLPSLEVSGTFKVPSLTADEAPYVERPYGGLDPMKAAVTITDQIARTRQYRIDAQRLMRDIGDIPSVSNPRLRAELRYNLRLFLEVMYPAIFYMGWSDDQLELINELERRILHGGLKAVAMPRGGGKSSIVFGTSQWAACYGHRKYIYVIKSEQGSADRFTETVRMDWETNKQLQDLFPEIGFPVCSLDGSPTRARMQTYNGERTYLGWSKGSIGFPCLYGFDYEIDNNSGVTIVSKGITGSFRGTQRLHPHTGEILRPDFIILDDIQSDKIAVSPTSVLKTIDLVDGAVKGLSPPGQLIAGVMPCTVICPDDVSDQYLNKDIKPEWSGMRCQMVTSWPDGITEDIITDKTEASRHWQAYANLRVESLQSHGDIHLATEYYSLHRDVMDANFHVSWAERYNKDPSYEGNVEISAQQHAMNLRLSNIFTFAAEYQNRPRKVADTAAEMPTAAIVQKRTVSYSPRIIPNYCSRLVGFIDVQDEMLWYGVCALSLDYTGVIIDYGVFPSFSQININKHDASKHRQMSREFYKAHMNIVEKMLSGEWNGEINDPTGNYTSTPHTNSWLHIMYEQMKNDRNRGSNIQKAPFEAKLTWALYQLVTRLFSENRYLVEGEVPMHLDFLGIDCRWGQAVEVVKRFICDYGDHRLVPYEGIYIGATSRTMAEYRRGNGALFEDELHKDIGCCRWVARYDNTTRSRKLLSDVNAWKSFLVLNRLLSPPGSPGALMLHTEQCQEGMRHPLLARHICDAEIPLLVEARGKSVYEWRSSGQHVDNDWLDCMAGCMALGSIAGCRIDDKPLQATDVYGDVTGPTHKGASEPKVEVPPNIPTDAKDISKIKEAEDYIRKAREARKAVAGIPLREIRRAAASISPHETPQGKPQGMRSHRQASDKTQQRRIKLSELAKRKIEQTRRGQVGR